MRKKTLFLLLISYHAAAAVLGFAEAFSSTISSPSSKKTKAIMSSSSCLRSSNTASTATAAEEEDVTIPSNLPSDCGMDYVPLATMLATGQFEEADQFTRDALITISGSKEKGRDFVYFTDVKRIPSKDLATMERLWNKFSKGKFGYSVQKKVMRYCDNDFELFCKRIGWTTKDGEVERKLRWFGASEFIYDLKKAPEGHLPLTSALRGTSLLKNLLKHPVWDNSEWKKEPTENETE